MDDTVEPKHALIDMSKIDLTAEDLYDKEKVDISTVELSDVWTLLQSDILRLLCTNGPN